MAIHRGDPRSTPSVVTPRDAGVPAPYDADDGFGTSPQSADFNRDGRADLAIGVPGRELVAVLYGDADGILEGRRDSHSNRGLPGGSRYGNRLVAGDFNGDGYADLAVGAPGEEVATPDTGAIELLLGGPDGLTTEGARTIRRPSGEYSSFGSRLRGGDVNGDGHLDLVEGAPDRLGGAAGARHVLPPAPTAAPAGASRSATARRAACPPWRWPT